MLGREEVRIRLVESKADLLVEGQVANKLACRDREVVGARIGDHDVDHGVWVTGGTGIDDGCYCVGHDASWGC